MQFIYKNELGSSFYDKDKRILIYKTNNLFVNRKTDLIKDHLENTYNLTHDKSIVGEVVDLTEMRGNFKLIFEYLFNDYYPKMKLTGMNKAAYVVSDDMISKNLVEKICAKNIIKTNSFQNIDQAIEWVTSVDLSISINELSPRWMVGLTSIFHGRIRGSSFSKSTTI